MMVVDIDTNNLDDYKIDNGSNDDDDDDDDDGNNETRPISSR